MRKLNFLGTLLFTLFLGKPSFAQDFSNKGKEFWLAYSYHVGMSGGGNPTMTLYLTSDVTTTYSVDIYGVTNISSGTINANQVVSVVIPTTYFINTDGITNGRTIRVTAVKPIVVYSFITRSQASAASLCLPVNVLGREYMASSFTQNSNESNANSYITIVAVEDNTNVEIIPSAATVGGWAANSVNNITLNKGQIYQVLGITTGTNGVDLSGTKIKTIASASGGCKKIAVFSGSGKIYIQTPGCSQQSSDNLYQQLYPVSTWGKKYLTVPSNNRTTNYYRIYRNDPLANVTLNGTLIPSASFTNNYYQFLNTTPNKIESDLPVSVSQYFTTQNCSGNGNPYDPDMIVLSPVEQNINKVTLVNTPLTISQNPPNQPHQHHIHVIMKNDGPGGTGRSSFRFDGATIPASSWVPHPQDANYSYLYISNIASGNHTLASDTGFNALAYGYGSAETYGYSAGANVKDLYQQIGVSTQFGIESTPTVCKGSPFKFKVSLPYCVDSIKWNLSNLPSPPTPVVPQTNYSSCSAGPGGPDSITFVNGIPLYWYSLSTMYTTNTSGSFAITLNTFSSFTNECGTQQDIDFDLNVYDPPVADFSWTGGGCVVETVQFQDNTTTPRPSYLWFWDFGDPASGASNTSTLQNPTHTFSSPGPYTINFYNITTPGCISNTKQKPITIAPIPSATITGSTSVCINTGQPLITFTATDGTAPYTFTYNINSGPNQTISTTGTNTSVTISVPTNVAGTFQYNLTEVKNTGSTQCVRSISNASATVNVNLNTGLTLTTGTNNQSVCENTAITNLVYTIDGGGNNATATGLPPGVSGVYNSGLFSISGTPTTPGTYNYTVNATGICLPNSLNGVITVNPDATLVLNSGNNTQSLCINTPISSILYTIGGGGTGGTVSGLPAGVTGTFNSGVLTISGSPTVTGTFNYTATTTGTCIQKTETGTITVNPDATLTLSSAPATTNQSVCENIAITNITYSIGGGGTGGTVSGLPPGVSGVYNAGLLTISGAPTVVGSFPYTINTTGTCVQKNLTGTITVNPDAAISLTSAPSSNSQELCRNSTLTTITYAITGGGTGGTVSGLPAGVTGTFSGGVFTISGTPTVAGSFNYSVNTSGTCVQKTANGTIIVNELPTPNFSLTTPTCETKVLSFTDLSNPNSGILTGWNWNFGDAVTSIIQNPTHTYSTAGPFTVTLSVTTDKGCVSNPVLTRNITVNPQPVTDVILPEVCLSDTYAQFFDNSSVASGSVNSWNWNFGDPGSGALNTSALEDPQHSYTAVGNYIVTLTTTTNNGCITTNTFPFTVNGDIPVANFNALSPLTMCANDSIALQDASTVNFGSVTKVEIYWDNTGAPTVFETDDTPTPAKIYKHKYPDFQAPLTKTFTIRYRAYSGGTCVNDRIKTVIVNASPKVQFNNIPDVCLDAPSYLINEASEIGSVPGTWAYSGPGVNAAGLFNPSILGPGTYNIKYIYTSTAGGCTDSLTKPITVLDSASAKFTFSALTCEKTAVAFNSSISTIPVASGTITGWNWDFGDAGSGISNTSTLQNPSHLFTGWGTYQVKLNVTTSNGCKSTVKTIPVFVNPIPRPNFSTPASSCLPSASVAFTNTSDIPDGTKPTLTYLWDFGDPSSGTSNSSTGTSPTHIYNTIGPFNVNLQVTSGVGCIHDTTIVLSSVHPQPTASFTVDKADVCVGQSIMFTDNSNPADGVTTQWNWTMGDGNVRITPSFNYNYGSGNPNPYDVTLYVINNFGCRSTSFTRQVTINPYPVVDAGPDLFILQDGSDTLEPIISGINPTYLWAPNMYFISNNTIKNPIVKGVEDITYTITVTGRGGCQTSDKVFIKVLKGPEIPNIFSPNGDGVHDKWIIKYLDTYPECTVEIFNRYGQRIFSSVGYGTPWDGTVNGKPVPIGTYYYIVNPKNGRKTMSGYVDIIR